jgi:hypothetical protein
MLLTSQGKYQLIVYCPLSIAFVILSINSIIASSVDLFLRNPYWCSDRIEYFSTKLMRRLYIIFSSIFATQVHDNVLKLVYSFQICSLHLTYKSALPTKYTENLHIKYQLEFAHTGTSLPGGCGWV